jgi:hypothetical protein
MWLNDLLTQTTACTHGLKKSTMAQSWIALLAGPFLGGDRCFYIMLCELFEKNLLTLQVQIVVLL